MRDFYLNNQSSISSFNAANALLAAGIGSGAGIGRGMLPSNAGNGGSSNWVQIFQLPQILHPLEL